MVGPPSGFQKRLFGFGPPAMALSMAAGCAASSGREPPTAPVVRCEDCSTQAGPARPASVVESRDEGGARSRSLSFDAGVPGEGGARWSVRRIGAGAPAVGRSRPKRGGLVDLDLVGAPFDEVARLLADTGHFNVVVEAPSASPVTVRLRGVEAYDALVVIAEVRGLAVRYRRGMVVVSPPEKEER